MKTIKVKNWSDIPNNFTGIIEYGNSAKFWYKDGKPHRADGPAMIYSDGEKYWYINGEQHRTDGPAVEQADGTKAWFKNDKHHRINGPAVERVNGIKKWFKNGKLHRTDGPAIEWSNENVEYWIYDIRTYKEAVEVYRALFPEDIEI